MAIKEEGTTRRVRNLVRSNLYGSFDTNVNQTIYVKGFTFTHEATVTSVPRGMHVSDHFGVIIFSKFHMSFNTHMRAHLNLRHPVSGVLVLLFFYSLF